MLLMTQTCKILKLIETESIYMWEILPSFYPIESVRFLPDRINITQVAEFFIKRWNVWVETHFNEQSKITETFFHYGKKIKGFIEWNSLDPHGLLASYFINTGNTFYIPGRYVPSKKRCYRDCCLVL